MKILLLGNAGAGKTTLARRLIATEPAALLSLDAVAFQDGSTERRPLADSVADAIRFVERHSSWIVEGCYADIMEALLPRCEQLILLNPGVAACVEHCRQRAWEPDKFASADAQDALLENLVEWVSRYETRDDEYGLRRHRALLESFGGAGIELTDAYALPRQNRGSRL